MSCRRVSRELLERFRFGEELDARSEPHLLHLQSCGSCRDEVGLDRALVAQLRRALQARVADASPPETSWSAVRARAVAPQPAGRGPSPLVRRLRLMPAAVAVSVMIFAVSVARDADLPAQIRVDNRPPYQGIPKAEPPWEMPWYLRYRPVVPVPPSGIGFLPTEVDDATQPDPPRASGLTE
jgi:hypothetical protein